MSHYKMCCYDWKYWVQMDGGFRYQKVMPKYYTDQQATNCFIDHTNPPPYIVMETFLDMLQLIHSPDHVQ